MVFDTLIVILGISLVTEDKEAQGCIDHRLGAYPNASDLDVAAIRSLPARVDRSHRI